MEQIGNTKTVYFIGCGVLGSDVNQITGKLNLDLRKKLLPGGLHNQPDELRRQLQDAIDKASQDETCVRIIVGYGLCGRGTVGIEASQVPLIFPKVHDCIALFMGSDQAYKEEFARYPGTYYISAGWCVEKEKMGKEDSEQIWMGSQAIGCKDITDKYGERGGREIIRFFSTWQKNYQRAAFIDTGVGKAEKYAKHAKTMAEKYNWEYQSIQGNLSLMTRLLTATDSDDQILVVPPGYITIYSATENALAAAPVEVEISPEVKPRFLVVGDENNKDLIIRYGLGIDAGGTYTDAAIFDFSRQSLICKGKALTTKWDFSIGIDRALSKLDRNILDKVELVSVSTTLATNAIVEGEGQKAGLFLMFGSGTVSDDLITHTPRVQVKGQMSISGQEIQAVEPDEIRRAARLMIERKGVTAFAVSGFAGAVNPSHELHVKHILQEETGMVVTCGHELSDMLDFVIRAQTAVLNARIIPRMIKFFMELDLVLEKRGIKAPVMVVKGDGTLMSSAMAKNRPVETVLSGPAASVTGAKLLSGLDDATVVDIGGTTTDTATLIDGMVDVCENGARVGGFATHVKALNMRTVGLGGDSLICWYKGELLLGPRRVAPIVWADSQSQKGVDTALHYMESRLKKNQHADFSQIVLVAMDGQFPFTPTNEENTLYTLLLERPYALEELTGLMNLFSIRSLPTERLEESGLIQRCGLTPTDILHTRGSFRRWKPDAAFRLVNILTVLTQTESEVLQKSLLKMFEKDLAKEVLRKQLSKYVDVEGDKETELSRHLMECILSRENDHYSIRARLKNPIIGIGAPVKYFLPSAGKTLNVEVVIPKDADVANALGAITSHIVVKKRISVRPDQTGFFIVQGVEGGERFKDIERAEKWAIENIKKSVLKAARIAGTSQKIIEMEIRDNIVNAGDGTALFLDRTISATLTGNPDISLESMRQKNMKM